MEEDRKAITRSGKDVGKKPNSKAPTKTAPVSKSYGPKGTMAKESSAEFAGEMKKDIPVVRKFTKKMSPMSPGAQKEAERAAKVKAFLDKRYGKK